MKKIFLSTIFLLSVSFCFSNEIIERYINAIADKAVIKLNDQISYNNYNQSHGSVNKCNYIINIDALNIAKEFPVLEEWIERNTGNNPIYTVAQAMPDAIYYSLQTKLNSFNNDVTNPYLKLYVFSVNGIILNLTKGLNEDSKSEPDKLKYLVSWTDGKPFFSDKSISEAEVIVKGLFDKIKSKINAAYTANAPYIIFGHARAIVNNKHTLFNEKFFYNKVDEETILAIKRDALSNRANRSAFSYSYTDPDYLEEWTVDAIMNGIKIAVIDPSKIDISLLNQNARDYINGKIQSLVDPSPLLKAQIYRVGWLIDKLGNEYTYLLNLCNSGLSSLDLLTKYNLVCATVSVVDYEKQLRQRLNDVYALKNNINLLDKITPSQSSPQQVVKILGVYSEELLATLNANQRIDALTKLIKVAESSTDPAWRTVVTSEQKDLILKLMRSAPLEQYSPMLAGFKNKGLYGRSIEVFENFYLGDDFNEFAVILTEWLYSTKTQDDKSIIKNAFENDAILPVWKNRPPGFFTMTITQSSSFVNQTGELSVKMAYEDLSNQPEPIEKYIQPDEWVCLYFVDANNINGAKRGEILPLPGIYLHWLLKTSINDLIIKKGGNIIRAGFDITMFFSGYTALRSGTGILMKQLAILDMGFSASDLTIQAFATDIETTFGNKGHEFVETWNKVYTYYGLGRLSIEAVRGMVFIAENGDDIVNYIAGKYGTAANKMKQFYQTLLSKYGKTNIADNIIQRISTTTDFLLQPAYTKNVIEELMVSGRSLRIPDDEIEHFIINANNKYKPIAIEELRQQILSWSTLRNNVFNSIEDFYGKLSFAEMQDVKLAFIDKMATLKFAEPDMYLVRHCNNGAPGISNWYTDEILTASQARAKLALPNVNTAQRVTIVKVPVGTPYIEGGVASQVNNVQVFGNYAIGGGKQFYFLDEYKPIMQLVKDILQGGGVGNFASHVDIQQSLSTILNLKNTNKLTKSINNATDIELAAIHKFTENGGVLNTPLRNGNEIVIGPVTFTEFQSQVYQSIRSGLVKLRQTNRLVTETVLRGRTYTLADFNTLFNTSNVNVPLKGMVSCTKNEAVAVDFLNKSGANISGSKVKVIMKIKSKNGVDIDDMSDWGVNLVNQRHSGELIQEEVLLEEGMFKKIGQPKKILNSNGTPKIDIDGTEWWEVELEELGTPLRTIN